MLIVQAVLAYKTRIIKQPAKPEDAHVERKRLFLYLNDSSIFNALFYIILYLDCLKWNNKYVI